MEHGKAFFPARLSAIKMEVEKILFDLDYERFTRHVDPLHDIVVVEASGHLSVDLPSANVLLIISVSNFKYCPPHSKGILAVYAA